MVNLARLPTLKERNVRYVRRVLLLCSGSVGRTANVLGIGRSTLYRWCVKNGIRLNEKAAGQRAEGQGS